MKALEYWLEQKRQKQQRFVLLLDSLVTGKFYPYLWFRLRFFSMKFLLDTAIHTLEFWLLIKIFTLPYLLPIILLRAIGFMAQGFWWGCLEVLRTRVRNLFRDGNVAAIREEASAWFAAASIMAIFLMGISSLIVFKTFKIPAQHRYFFRIYEFIIIIQSVIAIIFTTYHSMVYAVRRIYRPLLSLLLPHLIALTLLFLWPLLGSITLLLMIMVSGWLSLAISVFFVHRMYRLLLFYPLSWSIRSNLGKTINIFRSPSLWLGGIAFALFRMDGVLPLTIWLSSFKQMHMDWVALFYLIAPQLRAGYQWTRLLYFDFKKVDVNLFSTLKNRLDKQLFHLSYWLGLGFWLVAELLQIAFFENRLWWVMLIFLPFFVLRSLISFHQIKLFSRGYYLDVIVSGLLILSGAVILPYMPQQSPMQWPVYGGLLLVSLVYLYKPRLGNSFIRTAPSSTLALPIWYAELNRLMLTKQPLYFYAITLHRSIPSKQIYSFVKQLRCCVNSLGIVTRSGRHQFLCLSSKPLFNTAEWLKLGSGLITKIHSSAEIEKLGLHEFIAQGSLKPILCSIDQIKQITPLVTIKAKFYDFFPQGIVLDLADSASLSSILHLSLESKRLLINQARSMALRLYADRAHLPYEVTVLYQQGQIAAIFAVQRSSEPQRKTIKIWRRILQNYNLEWAANTQ